MDNQAFQTHRAQHNDYGFHDFINEGNLGQFIDLVRGENAEPITNFNSNTYDAAAEFMYCGGGLVDNQFYTTNSQQPQGDGVFDFNSLGNSEPNYILDSLPLIGEENEVEMEDDDENDEDDSSVTTSTGQVKRSSNKADRSKTLISERRRRGRMKEKLYALRSLVPNITKMDTASIVGDAVEYVTNLQMEARKLSVEIAELRSSLEDGVGKPNDLGDITKKAQAGTEKKYPSSKKIVQMDVFQEEEKGYYVRLACNKGEGVVVALYKALESLTRFDVQRSNFVVASDKTVMTFKLNGKECGEEMNMSTLKIWVTGALLNQGFEFITPVASEISLSV
ncbi:transcription factor FER-LIKE IRON DEFICIENCY-INDUCED TRANSCRIPTION FACTOR-like [Telopea speciosissima]|uniref:transcription factor FER-LIKE IRON DEFICIENCY-INDUCED TRANSCRIPTION FACTOR-like n=1 Tax=Telopea speciosissima TaxID=54955 RepID=UPI001CC49597|nr:transcription factor FER-LIKE IRON DEFICIENCY-INDUCED TRANSCRIPTION FACTOR-like [Telopea speciosissima]